MSLLIFLAVICAVAAGFLLLGRQGAKTKKPVPAHTNPGEGSGSEAGAAQTYTYSSQGSLFTRAELAFYRALQEAIADQYQIFGKVRVADVLKPQTNDRGDWQRAFNKISAKHFDFVLCSKDSLRVVAAVELDDRSHRRGDRIQRDDFLNQAVASAGLPLLRFPVQVSYDVAAVQQTISQALGSRKHQQTPSQSLDLKKPKPRQRKPN